LIDCVNSSLDVPETKLTISTGVSFQDSRFENSLFNRDIISETPKFALKTDSCGVIRTRVDGVEGAATLRVGIVVIILVLHEQYILPRWQHVYLH
jgi:hypothetical protein